MERSAVKTDRYLSFAGIACDRDASRIVSAIRDCLGDSEHPSPWQSYFATKLNEAERRGQDALYFVGSQVNAIRELFVHYACEDALRLLDRVEEECC